MTTMTRTDVKGILQSCFRDKEDAALVSIMALLDIVSEECFTDFDHRSMEYQCYHLLHEYVKTMAKIGKADLHSLSGYLDVAAERLAVLTGLAQWTDCPRHQEGVRFHASLDRIPLYSLQIASTAIQIHRVWARQGFVNPCLYVRTMFKLININPDDFYSLRIMDYSTHDSSIIVLLPRRLDLLSSVKSKGGEVSFRFYIDIPSRTNFSLSPDIASELANRDAIRLVETLLNFAKDNNKPNIQIK